MARFFYNRKPLVHPYSIRRLKSYQRLDDYLNLNYDYIEGKDWELISIDGKNRTNEKYNNWSFLGCT